MSALGPSGETTPAVANTSGTARSPGAVVLEADGLTKEFPARRHWLRGSTADRHRAVDGVSLQIRAGEVVGIVGASGSGKTTLARMLVHLITPTAGTVRLDGMDIFALNDHAVRSTVRPALRMIFQDPDAALNPAYPIGEGLRRALIIGGATDRGDLDDAVQALLRRVGMDDSHSRKYPDELSGGEKRRLGICRALSTDPSVIVADEPLSGLDVVLQERVLGLLLDAQRLRGFGLVLVSHDLDRVHQVCDRVLVMYAGRVVESAPVVHGVMAAEERYRHPYAVELAQANDRAVAFSRSAEPGRVDLVSSGAGAGDGCRYRDRCDRYVALGAPARCASETPELRTSDKDRDVACFFADAKFPISDDVRLVRSR